MKLNLKGKINQKFTVSIPETIEYYKKSQPFTLKRDRQIVTVRLKVISVH